VELEAVLALKAAVQVATHSLSISFEGLVGTGRLNYLGASDVPLTSVEPPSHPGISRNGLSTATNVTLRVRNSARIISLSGGRPVGVATGGLSLEHNDRESNQSPFGSRRAFTVPPMPADWHSPFSVPDPLAYDASRACTMLTDPRVRPATTVPKIVVNGCDAADDREPNWTDSAEKCWSPEVMSPALKEHSIRASERHYPENPSSTRHENEARAGVACTMYVPYRPWYEPIKKMDSHLDMYSVQELSDDRHEADPTSASTATPSPSVITEEEAEDSSMPMPIRSPPSLPLSQIVRNKRKPPVPPRRRKKRSPTRETSHMPVSLIVRTGARVVEGSISGLVKLPYLDELKQVFKGKPLLKRRASTGESPLATNDNPSIPVRHKHISRARSMDVIVKPLAHHTEMRRTRSASAPELTTPSLRSPSFPRLFELPAVSTRSPVESTHTDQVAPDKNDRIAQDPESFDPTLMFTRMDHICASWNSRYWAKAESYLTRHLTMVRHDYEIARKVRHLLGVCASYRGQWHRALAYFISVINKPVRELNQLDTGDKAAFYWLGDTYPEALYFSRCFSPNLSSSNCVDLRRLITAVRESLQTLAMRWHEIVSRSGVFFLVQYDSVDGHIATMDYFRIEVTRFSLRNGFGLNFCSENTNRARRTSTFYHTNGSLDGITKRELKRCLRGAIESACARQTVAGPKSTGSLRNLPASLLRLPRIASSSTSVPTPPRESTESSMSPAELETPQSTPQSSVDLSTLVPPIGTGMPLRARDRISVRSSYNERHLLGPLVR
jgi:hypothetical protein